MSLFGCAKLLATNCDLAVVQELLTVDLVAFPAGSPFTDCCFVTLRSLLAFKNRIYTSVLFLEHLAPVASFFAHRRSRHQSCISRQLFETEPSFCRTFWGEVQALNFSGVFFNARALRLVSVPSFFWPNETFVSLHREPACPSTGYAA
jgi:hypothetical protein